MKKFMNLTPHEINVKIGDKTFTFPPSGKVVRLKTEEQEIGSINGIPLVNSRVGSVEDLPNPQENTFFIVSRMVLDTVKNRDDLVSPDTGKTAVRNEKGQIVAVTRFITN